MSDDKYPEILKDLKDNIQQVFIELGISEAIATEGAHKAAELIRKHWGGIVTYIPKGTEYELSARDKKIWADFTGKNHHALCKKYDISLQYFYHVIKIQRQIDLKDRQKDMFGDDT